MSEENITPDVDLIRDALEFYDKNTEKYKNIIDKIIYVKFKESINEHEHNYIYVYDENKKELFSSRYEYIGLYEPNKDTSFNIWTWGWAIPSLSKKNTIIIRKLLMYGTELDPKQNFLKSELITSRFKINNEIQLDIHLSIASYLSKKAVIFKMKQFKNVSIENNLTNIKYPAYFSKITSTESTDTSLLSPDENYIIYYLFLLDTDNIK